MTPGGSNKAGFAVVDALTALTILASTIGLTIGAADVARRLSASAEEARLARGALDYLIAAPLSTIGLQAGRDRRFDWTLSLGPDSAMDRSLATPCRRTAELKSRTSGRRFEASSLEICPIEFRP